MRKVRIIKKPKYQMGGSTLQPVSRKDANIEAEVNETAITDLTGDHIPENHTIGGQKHANGGTPLNLPENSFIFSDYKTMRIKDPEVLKEFGFKDGKARTPATISKKYNLNKYKKIYYDESKSDIERATAKKMITDFNLKLGKLALVQESMKDFENGVPQIALPALESMGVDPAMLSPEAAGPEAQGPPQMVNPDAPSPEQVASFQYGGSAGYYKPGVQKAQTGNEVQQHEDPYEVFKQLNASPFGISGEEFTSYGNLSQSIDSKYGHMADEYSNADKKTRKLLDKHAIEKGYQSHYGYLSNLYDSTANNLDILERAGGNNIDDYFKKAYSKMEQERLQKANQERFNAESLKSGNAPISLPKAEQGIQVGGAEEGAAKAESVDELREYLKSHPELKTYLVDKLKTHLKSSKNYGQLATLSEEDLLSKYVEGNKFINALSKKGIRLDEGAYKERLDKNKNGREGALVEIAKIAKENGLENPLTTADDVAIFQAGYQGMQDAAGTDSFSEITEYFDIVPLGNADSERNGKAVSPVDGWFGDTTLGQSTIYAGKPEEVTEVVENTPEPIIEEVTPPVPEEDPNSPWYVQDFINTVGVANDGLKIKKHMPWSAPIALDKADPTFYDPTRALAANAEQASISAEASQAYNSPQSMGARLNAIQGQASTNAANTIANYDERNVGVANSFEQYNNQIENRERIANNARVQNDYDGTVRANQAFDDAKAQNRANLRKVYTDAITNKAKTQVMNEMYPQYNIDPWSGGEMEYDPSKARQFKKNLNTGPSKDLAKEFEAYRKVNPDITAKDWMVLKGYSQ